MQEGKHYGEVYAACTSGNAKSVWMTHLFRRSLKATLSDPSKQSEQPDKSKPPASPVTVPSKEQSDAAMRAKILKEVQEKKALLEADMKSKMNEKRMQRIAEKAQQLADKKAADENAVKHAEEVHRREVEEARAKELEAKMRHEMEQKMMAEIEEQRLALEKSMEDGENVESMDVDEPAAETALPALDHGLPSGDADGTDATVELPADALAVASTPASESLAEAEIPP